MFFISAWKIENFNYIANDPHAHKYHKDYLFELSFVRMLWLANATLSFLLFSLRFGFNFNSVIMPPRCGRDPTWRYNKIQTVAEHAIAVIARRPEIGIGRRTQQHYQRQKGLLVKYGFTWNNVQDNVHCTKHNHYRTPCYNILALSVGFHHSIIWI